MAIRSNGDNSGSGGGTGHTSYTKGDILVADSPATLVKLAVGADTQVLTADSVQSSGVKWAAAGGGGGSPSDTIITPDTVANLPAAGTAGRVFLPTDGVYLYRDNAATWDTWYNNQKVVEPVLGDFAWINQGAATTDITKGGIWMDCPAATTNMRILKKAAPATPYTITAAFLVQFLTSTPVVGLCFRQTSDGRLVSAAVEGSASYGIRKYTSPTANPTTYKADTHKSEAVIWIQISDDGVDRITKYSTDGQHFVQAHTVGRTDHLTADEVGFFGNSNNTTAPMGFLLLSWVES
jgi:hypothetical protein